MFHQKTKGNITIKLEMVDGKLNSRMQTSGIAKKTQVALTTLLINFSSLCLREEKDPQEIISRHLEEIVELARDKNVMK